MVSIWAPPSFNGSGAVGLSGWSRSASGDRDELSSWHLTPMTRYLVVVG